MYNSQYYTCEQIDERLLQGYLDDYNSQTGQSLTKAQFLTALYDAISVASEVPTDLENLGKDINLLTNIIATEVSDDSLITPSTYKKGKVYKVDLEDQGSNFSEFVRGYQYYIAKVDGAAGDSLEDTSKFETTYSSAEALNKVIGYLKTDSDNIHTQVGYYECDTAGATAAKTIAVANYALFVGGSIKVKFANKNTANNATLNINSQGAKALYYQGERASATNSWDAEEVVEIYYDGTSYYANNVKGGSGSGVYDVSKEHPTSGPNSDGKFTLEYILNPSNVNELIPVNKRYPGMTIQFVSTSDNKYVQYRYMGISTANADFTNVANWQGVDAEPIAGSRNLVESDGVYPLMEKGLYGKNVTIIGDDLSTFYGYTSTRYYPNSGSGVTKVSQTWWYDIIHKNNAILKENLSANDLRVTTTSSATNNLIAKVNSAQNTDVLFLAAGVVDDANLVSTGLLDFSKSDEDLDDTKIYDAYLHAVRIAITKASKTYCIIQAYSSNGLKETILKIAEYYKENGVVAIDLRSKGLEGYNGLNNRLYRLTINGMSQMGSIIQDCISSEAMPYVSLADRLGYDIVEVDAEDYKWKNGRSIRVATNNISTLYPNDRLSAYVRVYPKTTIYVAGSSHDIYDTYRIAAYDEYFNILPEHSIKQNASIGRIKYTVPDGVHYILVSTKDVNVPESGAFSQQFRFVDGFDLQNADNVFSYLKSRNINKAQGTYYTSNGVPGIQRNTGTTTLFPVFFKKENVSYVRSETAVNLYCWDANFNLLVSSVSINGFYNLPDNCYIFAFTKVDGNIEDVSVKLFHQNINLFENRYCDVNAVRNAVVISDWEHERMAHVCQLYFDYNTKFFFVPYFSSMGTSDNAGEKNVVVSKISPCALNSPTFFKPFEYGMTVGTFIASRSIKFSDPNIIFLSDGVTARCLAWGGNANTEVQDQETGYFYREFNKETLSLGNSVNICQLKYQYNGEDVIVNMTAANVKEFATRIMNKPTGPGAVLIMSPNHLVTTENGQTVIYSYLSGITSGIDGDWDGCIIKSADYGATWEYVSHRPNTEYLGMWEVGLALVGRKIFVLYKATGYPISYYDLDNDEWGDIVLQSYTGIQGTDSSRPLLYYNNNTLYAITNIYPRINDKGEIIYAGSGTPNSIYRSHVLIEKIDTTTLERTFFKEFWNHDSCQYFSALNVYGWDYFAFTEDRRRQTTADSIKGNISMLKVDWFQKPINNIYQEYVINKY